MKKTIKKAVCLAMTGCMLFQLAACSSGSGDENQTTDGGATEPTTESGPMYLPTESGYLFEPTESTLVSKDYDDKVAANRNEDGSKKYVTSEITPTICYDNLGLGYLVDEDKSYTLSLAEGSGVDKVEVSAVNSSYETVDLSTLAAWDEASYTLTANQSAAADGKVFLDLKAGDEVVYTVSVNISAAYPTNPAYDINTETMENGEFRFMWENGTGYDANCNVHDPALTEVEIDGVRYYYMVQTGWEGGNTMRRSTDLIHWEYLGKTTPTADKMEEYGWTEINDWMLKDASKCQYWAADIVPASYGGYWLYTCVVNSAVDEEKHDRVCTVLAWSPDLSKNSFRYVGCILQSISDYAQDALYYNVVALDPQVVYDEEGRMFLTYGSFGAGTYMIELDTESGLRKDGIREWLDEETINTYMEEARATDIGSDHTYYGKHMTYCAEGSVITHQYDIPIVDEEGNVTEVHDDYYYLMTCLGVLSRNYVLFTAKSDTIDSFKNLSGDPMASGWIGKELVTGLFPPLSGYRSDLDREGYITTADRIEGSTEYIAMSSFKWADYDFDIHAPGHGDLYTTSDGVNIAQLMVRTLAFASEKTASCDNGYPLAQSSTYFMMQAHQYYTNSAGDIVINANRYAHEVERTVTQEEFLSFAKDGKFQLVLAGDPYVTTEAVYVTLNADGTIEGDATGTWKMYGDNYIKLVIDEHDTYLGVVAASWLDNKDCAGMTVTAMGQTTGSPLYMNSETISE